MTIAWSADALRAWAAMTIKEYVRGVLRGLAIRTGRMCDEWA